MFDLPRFQRAAQVAVSSALVVLTVGMAACGGGGGGTAGQPAVQAVSESFPETGACTLSENQNWLRANVRENYLWTDLAPDLDPAGIGTLSGYFRGLLFKGNETIPADRWSGYSSAVSFSRFYGEGRTMGYGVAVAGQEVRGNPSADLFVRYVEPASPAAAAGVRRGQRVVSLNGRSTFDIISADDFSALSAVNEGDVLEIVLEEEGAAFTKRVTAAVYDLTPARLGQVFTTPGGAKLGYLFVQNMVSQTESELASAFAEFKAEGVSAVVLDLRYDGGGLVSVGARLASFAAGASAAGRTYARLVYNSRLSARGTNYSFSDPAAWPGVKRVYVLMGSRTCSASEQVISGLQGAGLEVVTIGDSTCGKPVGFVPQTFCERTFSIVNFESVNASGTGGYYNGLKATCAVVEDPRQALAQPGESLLAAAFDHADGKGCPVTADGLRQAQRANLRRGTVTFSEPDLWQGMVAR